MKLTLIAAAAVLSATTALAEAEKFTVDASHSQVAFSYNHAGFSTTHGLVSGFEGEVMFDQDDPAALERVRVGTIDLAEQALEAVRRLS